MKLRRNGPSAGFCLVAVLVLCTPGFLAGCGESAEPVGEEAQHGAPGSGTVDTPAPLESGAEESGPEESGPEESGPDADAIALNNRGVALMGSFDYPGAHEAFRELVARQPDWTEARLNLAIATLNRQQPGDESAALAIAQQVMSIEPDNLRAHYIAGILSFNAGEISTALEHFGVVVAGDPGDAYAQYFFAQASAQSGDFDSALAGYTRAMSLDPYLRSAYYGAFTAAQRLGRRAEAAEYLESYQRLDDNPRARLAEIKYTRMGEKAMAWAVPSEPRAASGVMPEGALFGAASVLSSAFPEARSINLADLDGDQELDLLIDGRVWVRGTEGTFDFDHGVELPMGTDAGMVAVGDVNNDGRNDLFRFNGSDGDLWLREEQGWRAQGLGTAAQDALLVDADHDGDLDVLLAGADGGAELLNNNRDGSFRPLAEEAALKASAERLLVTDLDGDRDQDLIFIGPESNTVYLNDRLWSWRRAGGFSALADTPVKAMVAGDLDADGRKELYALTRTGGVAVFVPGDSEWVSHEYNWPESLLDAPDWIALADADGDGREDLWLAQAGRGWQVVDLSADQARMLHDEPTPTRAWQLRPGPRGPGLIALSGDRLMLWPAGPGRHDFVTLWFSGAEDQGQSMRSNASGIGTEVALRTGTHWSATAIHRADGGPGASLLPWQVGLGGAERADYVAIEWSDGVFQTELDVVAGSPVTITETQRQLASCPVLFAWNGSEFEFVSDVLGVGGMGFAVGRNEYATPRPWERFLLPEGLLAPLDGHYEIRFTEPMEELAYLDSVSLMAYDLPPGWHMLLDERMGTGGPSPTGEAWFYRDVLAPAEARSSGAGDVLSAVLEHDLQAAELGSPSPRFLGFLARPEALELSFESAIPVPPEMTPFLILDGWVEYGYSQTGFAAWQAGVRYQPPSLDIRRGDQWESWLPHFGYPAGMPRRAALPLTGLPPDVRALRLRTNQEIYFDRLGIALATRDLDVPRHDLPLVAARVAKAGFPRRDKLAQRRPVYDYSERQPFWDTRYAAGYYTRLGPALELVQETDDALAIIGAGEEIRLRFAASLPAPAPGWTRRFVLHFHGWAKDMDLYTRDGESVAPLPDSGLPAAIPTRLHARYNDRYQSGR